MCTCSSILVLIQGDQSWHRAAMVWLSIPCVVAGHDRCMGAFVPTTFVSCHTDAMDRMSIPVVAMPTLFIVLC